MAVRPTLVKPKAAARITVVKLDSHPDIPLGGRETMDVFALRLPRSHQGRAKAGAAPQQKSPAHAFHAVHVPRRNMQLGFQTIATSPDACFQALPRVSRRRRKGVHADIETLAVHFRTHSS